MVLTSPRTSAATKVAQPLMLEEPIVRVKEEDKEVHSNGTQALVGDHKADQPDHHPRSPAERTPHRHGCKGSVETHEGKDLFSEGFFVPALPGVLERMPTVVPTAADDECSVSAIRGEATQATYGQPE
jgi:hypothetical protein